MRSSAFIRGEGTCSAVSRSTAELSACRSCTIHLATAVPVQKAKWLKRMARYRISSAADFRVLVAPITRRVYLSVPQPIPIGVRGDAEETVEFKHTLTAHHPSLPPVYSTPDMIRLMEIACFNALQPYCDEGEITVGTAINVKHLVATGIGMRIRAEAELESFDGRFYKLRVTAQDGAHEIGNGTIDRAVVNLPKFMARLREKAVRRS